jgi:hypothetical protein
MTLSVIRSLVVQRPPNLVRDGSTEHVQDFVSLVPRLDQPHDRLPHLRWRVVPQLRRHDIGRPKPSSGVCDRGRSFRVVEDIERWLAEARGRWLTRPACRAFARRPGRKLWDRRCGAFDTCAQMRESPRIVSGGTKVCPTLEEQDVSMKSLWKQLPSPSMVVALTALVVALGGTAVAATQLFSGDKLIKPNSLSGNRLRKHTITGTQVNLKKLGKVPSAKSADTATNATNATNASHAASASTVTGQGTLASGQTEIGIIGGRFQNGAIANSPMAISTTFPLMAPVALSTPNIEVAPSAHCTGSTSTPTAAKGFVCIYPDITVFANNISGNTGVVGDTKLGFQMEWNATTANTQSSVRAEWAFTAP